MMNSVQLFTLRADKPPIVKRCTESGTRNQEAVEMDFAPNGLLRVPLICNLQHVVLLVCAFPRGIE